MSFSNVLKHFPEPNRIHIVPPLLLDIRLLRAIRGARGLLHADSHLIPLVLPGFRVAVHRPVGARRLLVAAITPGSEGERGVGG